MTGAAENGARLVFRVVAENTRPFDPAAPDATGQIDRISQSIGNDMATSFVQKLRDDLGTTLNAGAIAQVAGGGEG
jgi:peptidyl-prolyl cis-trans isomerase D